MKKSQINRILEMLEDVGDWVCGRNFLEEYIPEYRSRINTLRKKGYVIRARRCQQHNHESGLQEWRLLTAPESQKIKIIEGTNKDLVQTYLGTNIPITKH